MSTSSRKQSPKTSPSGTTTKEASNEPNTLPPIDCAPWCEVGDGHIHATHPDDQSCIASAPRLELAHKPMEYQGTWYRRTLDIFLWRKPFTEPAIDLVDTDEHVTIMTVSEARLLVERLASVCDLAEGRS